MRLLIILLIGLVPIVQAQPDPPFYEAVPCFFEVPPGETVECGYLTVLEKHDEPDGDTIRLYMAYFRSHRYNAPDDPIIYLIGGPGVSALYDIALTYTHFKPFLANRDVIVLDQRGTGYSEPTLDCDLGASRACRDELVALGIDLSAYNTSESAADVNDLRLALGYEQINLVGVSYGTRLALTVMRDYPDGVRSAILDSVLPLDYPTRTEEASDYVNMVIRDCQQDAICSRTYPNLRAIHRQNVERLNLRALTIFENDRLNGTQYVQQLNRLIWRTDLAWQVPRVIYDVANGDYDYLYLDPLAGIRPFEGMGTAILCNDEAEGGPYCESWGADGQLPLDAVPLRSDVPTLIVNGRYDIRTPTSWAASVDRQLANSYFYEFEYLSHGVIRSGGECPQAMAYAFLDDPSQAPDTSCIREMQPHFDYNRVEVGG